MDFNTRIYYTKHKKLSFYRYVNEKIHTTKQNTNFNASNVRKLYIVHGRKNSDVKTYVYMFISWLIYLIKFIVTSFQRINTG